MKTLQEKIAISLLAVMSLGLLAVIYLRPYIDHALVVGF